LFNSSRAQLNLVECSSANFTVHAISSTSDNFADAVGELYDLFKAAGANMVGATSTDGYEHSNSKAMRDGKFVGLLCDEDNQYDLSEERAKAWVEQLKSEGAL